jgi:hypothetical protein
MLVQSVEVEDSDELISADEIAASEAALLDYRTGQDSGISSTNLKEWLFGDSPSRSPLHRQL